MEEEKIVTFFVVHGKDELIIQLYEYDTVELLKIEIHKKFQIPAHKQIIEGWKNVPQSEDTILKMCVQEGITYLRVQRSDYISPHKDMELEAAHTFINKFANRLPSSPLEFNICKLSHAISDACLGSLAQRKALLLCLHAGDDKFSRDLLNVIRKPKVIEILQKSFFLLGWDIEDTKFHSALTKALNDNELDVVDNLVKAEKSAVLSIVPIKDSVTIFNCIRTISEKSFIEELTAVEKAVIDEVALEKELKIMENQTDTNEYIDSERFHLMMAERLGDRDYDGFDYDQHESLKEKIGFALFGPPQAETGYNDKQKQKIDKLFNIILVNSNDIAQYKDRVEIAFIYNCLEPLPQEKIKKKEENKDYNPKTDIMPIPIFVLRKCVGSDDPCRLFIDDTGRVYETFQNYIKYNKLHACFMVLPSNGRYTFDRDENLMLESHLSPACQVDAKILQGCDYASTAGGLLSGGVLLAAAIPAIPVAPVAVIGAGLTGLGVGIYSIGRSIFTLHDKYKHKESLSFADSETRGAYLNIVAGALGFAGAGANVAVTQLVSRGVPIGKGVSAFVTGIGIVNIGASGVSVFNSGYDIYDQWFNEKQTPSLLTIVQLSSSLLFFGNAVYSFKTCATMVHETQSRVLQDYKESLRSNRHRIKRRLLELRTNIFLPSGINKSSVKCNRCQLDFIKGPASHRIIPSKRQSKFQRKILARVEKEKPMTRYQMKYFKHMSNFSGNKLEIKCNFCKKETLIKLSKPNKIETPESTLKPRKKKKKKDKFCGLDQTFVLSATTPNNRVLDKKCVNTLDMNKKKNSKSRIKLQEGTPLKKIELARENATTLNRNIQKKKRSLNILNGLLQNKTPKSNPASNLKSFLQSL